MDMANDFRALVDTPARGITVEDMQQDFDYEIAQMLTRSLLDNGFISEEEHRRISKLNKESFSPLYKELIDL